jgi:hypothetical protein
MYMYETKRHVQTKRGKILIFFNRYASRAAGR